jgi:hypothetical protein
MEMIDRYLQAVKFALPQAQRDDIIKELRDSILSQIEEKEATLGRPLNEDEQAELLKKLGSPIELASRYHKQRYLIGATMFPIYWKVLKTSLALAFVVLAAGSIATAAAGKTLTESLGVLFRYPSVALMTFAWMTMVFSALEFFGARLHMAGLHIKEGWDPRKLPPLVKADPSKSQFELIAQLLTQTLFGVWWLAGLHYQYLVFGPGIAFLRFGPVWKAIYPLFVVLVIVDLSLTASRLIWPRWTEGGHVTRLVMSALGIIVLYFLIGAPDLFVASDANTPQLQALAKNLNLGVHIGLTVALLVNIYNVVKESARLIGRSLGRVLQGTVGG